MEDQVITREGHGRRRIRPRSSSSTNRIPTYRQSLHNDSKVVTFVEFRVRKWEEPYEKNLIVIASVFHYQK